MEAQHGEGLDARKLVAFWIGGSLLGWLILVLLAGLLLLSYQLRLAKEAFAEEAGAAYRHAEAILRANEHAIAALAAFAEHNGGNLAALERYARRLQADFPQLLQAALLMRSPPQDPAASATEAPQMVPVLGRPSLPVEALPSLHETLQLAGRQQGPVATPMLSTAAGESMLLLVRSLQVDEADTDERPALLLPVTVGTVLAAAGQPTGLSVMLAEAAATAELPARNRWFPVLHSVEDLMVGGRRFTLVSSRQLGWDALQPYVAAGFLAAAAGGLLLAVRYGRGRIRREFLRRSAEFKLYQLANYDSLTGLPNRNLFKDRLQRALARARQDGTGVALCFIDLDGFKAVNDNAGHDTGDRLLRLVADRLSAVVRAQDTIARLSGDEFVVVLEGVRGKDDAERVMAQLQHSFAEPFEVGKFRFLLTASIGLAVFPDDGDEPAQLLRQADARMYAVKYPEWVADTAPAWMPEQARLNSPAGTCSSS